MTVASAQQLPDNSEPEKTWQLKDGRKVWGIEAVVLKAIPLPSKYEILRVFRRGSGNRTTFAFLLANGESVHLSDVDLDNRAKVKRAFRAATNGCTPDLPSGAGSIEKWEEAIEIIYKASEPEDSTLSEDDEAREWIASATRDFVDVALKDSEALFFALGRDGYGDADGGFRGDDGRLYVRLRALTHHVRSSYETVKQAELCERIGRLGFEKVQLSARGRADDNADETVRKARLWMSPVGFDPEVSS